MVGWLNRTEKRGVLIRMTSVRPLGFPLLEAAVPPGGAERRICRGARALRRRGVCRVLLAPGLDGEALLERCDLSPVDPLPLCRAMGGALALFLVQDIPLRQRWAALRGEEVTASAWVLAQELCPLVGNLLLDFDRGEEELRAGLRARFGAAALHLGQGREPQVAIELSPRKSPAGETLRLWGRPELRGLGFAPEGAQLPRGLPTLPFLELLWEAGRLKVQELTVFRVNRP